MSNSFYKDKKILVAGGSGMIGISLVNKLLKIGAKIIIVSLDDKKFVDEVFQKQVEFIHKDLTDLNNCLKVTKGKDYVFNLVGIKGSVGIDETKVASYFVPMLRFQTNLMDASFKNNVQKFLFVSSICAYPQSNKPKEEETVWDGMPKQNDRIPGIAKRVGELQGETYLKEYGWDAVKIVRPSNVFGPFDDFNPKTAQVIPALIARMINGENPVKIWGDGSAIRDFIFVDDAADGMILALEKAPTCLPINLGTGKKYIIKKIAQTIARNVPQKQKIDWDTTKPTGDPIRLLSVKRATDILGFKPKHSLEQAILKTINWYVSDYQKFKR